MTFFSAGSKIPASKINLATSPPIAQLRQTTLQTLTTSVWTALLMQTEDIDTHNGHSAVTNISRYTCQVAGKYELDGGAAFSASATGQRWLRWHKNGVEVEGSGANMDGNASQQTLMSVRSVVVSLAVGDYVELYAFQSSGADLATYVGVTYAQSSMCIKWISD